MEDDKSQGSRKDDSDKDENKPEEKKERVFEIDEYYPSGHREKVPADSPFPARLTKFHEVFGQESYRRYNLQYLAKDTLIFITGNAYQIYNVQTHERQVFFGQDSGGIGAIAVHPSKTFYAVAEKGDSPNIYVYEYPSLKLYRVLRKGTTKYYTSIDFSPSGERLASVGGDPDYQLSIWDWRQEKLLLKAKAFSQEVFKCGFSPYGDYALTTSGTGHIRFWKIAQTFTGLKLQSEIGKFGQLELSDVSSFAELQSGLVLCGTEYGTLLLWDGNLVKAHIRLVGGEPLHKGMIEQVIVKDTYVVTAGSDGFIKWFDLNTIANSEPDETLTLEINQVYAFQIKSQHGTPAYIVNILQGPDHWLIADGRGKIWNLNTETKEYKEVLHFHSGKITDLALPKEINAAVSLGSDGAMKLWDFTKSMEVYTRQFAGEGLCLDWMPGNGKNHERVLAAGFAGGIVRIILLGNQNFQLLTAFKALDSDIVKVGYSPDGTGFVAAGADGSLFFFEVSDKDLQQYEPVCLTELKQKINDLRWHKDGKRILIATESGNVIEVLRPEKDKLDTKASYVVTLPTRSWTIKMMEMQMKKNQQKDESEEEKRRRKILMYTSKDAGQLKEEEEKEWDPAPILTCMYHSDDANSFMITADKEYRGYVYVCSFDSPRPLKGIDYGYKSVQCLSLNLYPTEDILSIGLSNGRYQVRHTQNTDKYIEVNAHDTYAGRLRKIMVNFKKTFALSAGEDGLLFVYKLNGTGLEKLVKYHEDRDAEDVKVEDVDKIVDIPFEEDKSGIELLELDKAVSLTKDVNIDIDPKTALSLQNAKLQSEENAKQEQAQSKKEKMKAEVQKLRQEYERILKSHISGKRREIGKEFDDVINVDHEYFEMLSKQIEEQIQEVCKELEYDKEKHKVAVEKLRAEYLDPLEYGITTLKGIKSSAFVRTFRLTKLAEFVENGLKEQEELARLENLKKDKLDTTEEESIDGSVPGGGSPKMGATAMYKSKGTTFHLDPAKEKVAKKTTAELNQEKRRQDRLKKRDEKEVIKKMQPKDEDDPVYKAKMDSIMANKGDKKLKSDEYYDVPEEQRRDAKKQRYEMLLLAKGLYNIQKYHNDKVLSLRDWKAAIVDKSINTNKRISEINKELEVKEELFQPQIDQALEYPEKYYQIQDENLIEYLQKQKPDLDSNRTHRDSEDGEQKQEDYYDTYLIDRPKDPMEVQVEDENKLPPERKDYVRERSAQEDEQEKIKKIELLYEKETLQNELNKEIADFDKEVELLQHMKLKLESDKKYGEMKLIMGYDALCMLKGLVDRDMDLTEKLGKCKEEKAKIAKQFSEIAAKMKEKEMLMNNLKEEKDQIMARFDELIPINHVAREELYSFFMRRIKRKAKNADDDKPDDSDSGEKEEDEVAEESEDEEDKNAWDEDEDAKNQPGGPNKEQYHIDQIIEERAKKLDLEEKLKKMAKENAELQKKSMELERQKNRIDQDEQMIDDEIKIFQREKMKRLNKMEQSFVLRLSQMQNLEPDSRIEKKERHEMIRTQRQQLMREIQAKIEEANNAEDGEVKIKPESLYMEGRDECVGHILPADLRDSLLFTEEDIKGLLKKIEEHKSKIEEEGKLRFTKNQDKIKKGNQIKEKTKEMKRKQQILEDELQLKFGSIIKLDEEIPWTANTENIKKKESEFSKAEKAWNAKIRTAELELDSKKRELNEQVKRNTDLLKHIKAMGEKSTELQKKLNSANEQIFKMDNAEQRNKLIEEKNELEEKLNVQNYKIDTIRKEIELFRRKGGHIYTTITANRRVAGGNPSTTQ